MYASNPKSRIARENLYILKSIRKHYLRLMSLDEDTTLRFGKLLVLMTIYMLREEGIEKLQPAMIAEHTQGVVARSSVYKYVKQLFEEGILEEEYGDYICLARTPKFLLNPEELYGKPLTKVQEKDYALEEKIKEIVAEMMVKNMPVPVPQGTTLSPRPAAIPVHDTGRFTQQDKYQSPSSSTEDIQKAIKKKKKKKKPEEVLLPEDDQEPNEVEEDLKSFFM